MNGVVMHNKKLYYYNTNTADHIFGIWDQMNQVITELHSNRNGQLFFAVYDEGNGKEYVKRTTPENVLSFIDDCNKKKIHIRWFPGGKDLLQKIVNMSFSDDGVFTG